jgi:thiamine transport system permease protein
MIDVAVTGLTAPRRTDTTLWEAVTSPTVLSAAWFTVWQSVVTTVATVALGLPAAWAASRSGIVGSRLFLAATTVPFVLPTVVVGTAFADLLGPRGPLGIDLRGTATAVIVAHVFYNLAIVARIVGARWASIPPETLDAAATLGATRTRTFLEVTLPALRPAIVAASSLVFLLAFTSFGTVLILGELRVRTLEVEIWRQVTQRLDLGAAAVIALVQLAAVAALLTWYGRAGRVRTPAPGRSRPPSPRARRAAYAILTTTVVALAIPIAGLVTASLRGASGPTLEWYRRIIVDPAPGLDAVGALGRSLGTALVAMGIAIVVGGCAAVVAARGGAAGRRFDTLVMLPLGVSAVTIGLGFLLALDRPVDLRGTWAILPLAHSLVAIPFVVRSVAPALGAIPEDLRLAARTLGADRRAVLRTVDWPLTRRSVLVGAGFALALSLGEFGATAFVGRPTDPTLPILVFRLLGRPGSGGSAAAAAVLLMAVTALAVLIVERFRTGREAL